MLLVSAEMHFNPLPPHGGRRTRTQLSPIFHVFQSTPSTRRETTGSPTDSIYSDISIHSLHTEGDIKQLTSAIRQRISIHSLHTEGDMNVAKLCAVVLNFNPLPPHGGRPNEISRSKSGLRFQSTPSTRRETHSVCRRYGRLDISIHSLRMEGDGGGIPDRPAQCAFQSTPSAWRETGSP